jgi:hypothetical protein
VRQPAQETRKLFFRDVFGHGFHISTGFFLGHVDSQVKVMFDFRGLDLSIKAGFERWWWGMQFRW